MNADGVATRTFTCAHCGGVFDSDATEEELLAEEREQFGFNSPPETRASVCTACYDELLYWMRERKIDPREAS